MSFGFGVGDFLAVIEIAHRIRKEFVEAPVQFKAIAEEVRSLSFVVQDVEIDLSSKSLTEEQRDELESVVSSCQAVLFDLEKTLDSFKELATADHTKRSIAKRAWKRLKWEPTEIQELRSRINSNIALLNSINGRAVRNNVAKLVWHQDDQERHEILTWLSPTNYATQQSDYIGRRQQGTGQWLLDSSEFRSWASGSKGTLFCPGIPGAGKTILAAIIVEELYEKYGSDREVAIAQIYCNFQRQSEQNAVALIANILRQVVQAQDSLPGDMKALYDRHKPKGTRPVINDLVKVFQSICGSRYRKVYLVIDALDECQVSDGSRTTLVKRILDIQAKCNLNLLVTSRFSPDITEHFRSTPMLEIRATKADVERYLHGNLAVLPSFVSRDQILQEQLSSGIAEAADGMFLLAQLFLNSFIGKRSPKAIKIALKNLSSGVNTYDSAYNDAVDRINGQVPDQTELALQVLSWVTCAKRQLTTIELQTALAVEIGEEVFDKDNVPDITDMVAVCAGLVTVDEQSNIIRLVHYTAQEYFERHRNILFPNAHREIGTTCVAYLSVFSFDCAVNFTAVFGFDSKLRTENFRKRDALYGEIDKDPFSGYAAVFWGHHMREMAEMDPAIEQQTLSLLDDESKLNTCLCIMFAKDLELLGKNQELYLHCRDAVLHDNENSPSSLHVATWFGLTSLVQRLINRGGEIDYMDCFLQTALSRAVSRGFGGIASLLLLHNGSQPTDRIYFQSGTLLSLAARYDHLQIADLILGRGCDIDSCGSDKLTALHYACMSGSELTAKYLAAQGANLELKDRSGRSPLHCATASDHISIVMILLDAGAAIDETDDDGATALWHAIRLGYSKIGQFLWSRGANPNVADTSGDTALILSSKYGRCEIVDLLISWKVDLECVDTYGQTALLAAASAGHEDVVRLLQEKGADLHHSDNSGRNAFFLAVSKEHEALAAALASDFNPNQSDRYGRTPLHAAAILGHVGVIRILLCTDGVDCNARDNFGRTPLYDATMQSHHNIVEILRGHAAVLEGHSSVSKPMTEHSVVYRACDVCLCDIIRGEAFHHCFTCHGGDFDICDVCHQVGARCLNSAHQLTMRPSRNR
ncbi:hypothetical protein N7541_004199 [Penicillium brevicompactum]|uniref:NACHT domain-containing protein n=1 Tax=Penicillium brevicompactum TaxID=5074 RepID=A0A9W9V1S9_PENBR|nr:hypothetical protein N7541_004199 [Penicillium brevicompactum]